jgi:error-prone DNA polymerase
MDWNNPPIPWSELERRLSQATRPASNGDGSNGAAGSNDSGTAAPGDGGDSPAWSPKRAAYRAPEQLVAGSTGAAGVAEAAGSVESPEPVVPYAELHVHSAFSFLDGASMPERLAEEARALGLHALALTDHDGFAGAARFAEAAGELALPTVLGAELSIGLPGPQQGVADPAGTHLLVLARGAAGYHRLAGAITEANLRDGAQKGRPLHDLDELAQHADGHWVVLTGCRKGAVRRALAPPERTNRPPGLTEARAAGVALDALIARFGAEQVAVELTDLGSPLDGAHNDALAALARERGLRIVATGNVHYAQPEDAGLASAVAAVRARRSMEELDPWLPSTGAAHLRSGAEMAARFARYPGAVAESVAIADETAFELARIRPALPDQEVPPGHTPDSWLRELTWRGVHERGMRLDAAGRERVAHELDVIEHKGFAGYFLIVHDLVRFARERGILCQGRGSAAASVVCYLLQITAIDSIRYGLPFERFISELRETEPDIDVDFESGRREEVIQYVFAKYGRRRAAQVCNVIQYRPKNAVRDMAKALGYSTGQQDAWSKQVERWGASVDSGDHDIPAEVVGLATRVMKHPRHLGIHSGGMVLTQRPVGEVVPIEPARMADRTVLQWDKDDCAWMGLVKFDLLGLGILSALRYTFELGERWDLASIPKEEAGVYDQLCRADAIGVFQVESRAQLGLLPRLQPREFYHLVVQIALVRPGPIQGGAVHPYVRRRTGVEDVTYLHPKLEPVLERTLGIPVFQEQLMQIAVTVGGCSPEDSDRLRRAMGSKRGVERIDKLRDQLYEGFLSNGIVGEDADRLYQAIQAFAGFGFAESHALSFGLIVYASAWLRLHYPAAFLAAMLRAQPMGFYSPQSLVADARRHGVRVLRPCILRSGVHAGLEVIAGGPSTRSAGPERPSTRFARSGTAKRDEGRSGTAKRDEGRSGTGNGPNPVAERAEGESKRPPPTGSPACLHDDQPPPSEVFDPAGHFDADDHRRDGAFAVRQGLATIRGIGEALATRIVAERESAGPFVDLVDLAHRVGLTTAQLEALAAADAFETLGLSAREAMWAAGQAARDRPELLPGTVVAVQPPLFDDRSSVDALLADLWATGLSPDSHPVAHLRDDLRARGILSVADLATAESGRRVQIAGVVTHRQRPATASGITFVNLEDETGMANVICGVGFWGRHRRVMRESPALVVRGMLERSPQGVINLLADGVEPLSMVAGVRSRDFR